MGASMLQGVVCCCGAKCQLCDPPRGSVTVTVTGVTLCPCYDGGGFSYELTGDINGAYLLANISFGTDDSTYCTWTQKIGTVTRTTYDIVGDCTGEPFAVDVFDVYMDAELTIEGDPPTYYWRVSVYAMLPPISYGDIFNDKIDVADGECDDVDFTNDYAVGDCWEPTGANRACWGYGGTATIT